MSYANTFQQAPTNTTNTTFRAWGQNLSSRFLSAGLVKTSDTGQIDWTTVAAPSVLSTSQGYEIWRFADALHGAANVYMKIEYGSSAGAANNVGMWLTVGNGSNGSGTLNGVLMTRQAFGTTAHNTNTQTCYFSGDTDRCGFGIFTANTGVAQTLGMLFSIERTKDANGVNTSEGALITIRGAQQGYLQGAWNITTGGYLTVNVYENSVGILIPSLGTGNAGGGTQLAVYPHFFSKGVYLNAGLNIMSTFVNDFTVQTTHTIPVLGTNHVYAALGNAAFTTGSARNANNTQIMLRYE